MNSMSPVSGFCYAQNRVCNTVLILFKQNKVDSLSGWLILAQDPYASINLNSHNMLLSLKISVIFKGL